MLYLLSIKIQLIALMKNLEKPHMKHFSFLLACGLMEVQLEEDKMMKKIKKNLTHSGDQ